MTHSDYLELVNTVKHHNFLYTVKNQPVISDTEYDRMYFQLQEYEQQHPTEIANDSPTQTILYNKNGRRQVLRRTTMLSTQKVKADSVMDWARKTAKKAKDTRFTLEWKYDGEPVSLTYMDGDLIEAAVSKGATGSDVLEHVQRIPGIPKFINCKGRVEIHGEAIVALDDAKRLGYDNARGAAHGLLTAERAVDDCCLIDFAPFFADGECFGKGQFEDFVTLNSMGFKPSEVVSTSVDTLEESLLYFEQNREHVPFPTDGVVIKMADRSKWAQMGATSHHPKYSAAYKFAPVHRGTTRVTRIESTFGEKTGKETVLIYFEPLTLNGGTYDHSGNDTPNTLKQKGIKVGDTIEVVLRNDVIVYSERVVSASTEMKSKK